MEALKDHVIIYDDECPMCNLYTRTFVKAKMLDDHGRQPYSWMYYSLARHVDKRRARNEIALVNTKTGDVCYGIDSLYKILGHRFALLRPVFENAFVNFLIRKLYSLISYNRRVIIPAEKFEAKNSCTPDFNVFYRWMYITFCLLITSLILTSYAGLMTSVIPASSFSRELLICSGQIFFQALILLLIDRKKVVHYLGNMMTISLGGGLLLIPAFILEKCNLVTTPYFFAVYLFAVTALMFLEHIRRTKILVLNGWPSVTWIFYQLLIAAFMI